MKNKQYSNGNISSSIELNYTIDCFQEGFVVIEFDWGSVSSDKLCECNHDEGRPISVRL
jgi:hypothetical protein